jgi:predicted nucleic acid-binding protein
VATKLKKVLFVDTNIWLDFYRSRNDASMGLLAHLEQIADRIVVTYQLESEYKKNRQAAILEGMQDLKPPQQIPRPAMFSDARASALLNKHLKEAEKRVKALKAKLAKALANPAAHDPVYQACQRVFHQDSPLALTRDNPIRNQIRENGYVYWRCVQLGMDDSLRQ